jgi:hypothetical protein
MSPYPKEALYLSLSLTWDKNPKIDVLFFTRDSLSSQPVIASEEAMARIVERFLVSTAINWEERLNEINI